MNLFLFVCCLHNTSLKHICLFIRYFFLLTGENSDFGKTNTEKSRCFEDNTSTNATFARSSLPQDSNLLITTSALLFASLKVFLFLAQRPKIEQKGAGKGVWELGLWGHKSPPNFQPQNSLTLQDREPKSQRIILPGNGKRAFPILLAAAAASDVLPIKTAGVSPAETNWGTSAAGHPMGSGSSHQPPTLAGQAWSHTTASGEQAKESQG